MKLLTFVFVFGSLLFVSRLGAQSAATKLLPFQGRLADATGKPIPDGVRLIQFRIFDAATGGNSVWPPGELHRATVNGGLINLVLGSKTLFTGVDFNRTLYLDIVVDANGDNQITSDDPSLLPRQAILPVIFATESADSRKLAGYDWTSIFGTNNPSGKIDGARLANITSNAIASGTINGSLIATQTISSAQLADAAIQPRHLSTNSVPWDRLAVRATNSILGRVAVSASTGAGWISPRPTVSTAVSNLTVALRTRGGPVIVFLTGAPEAGPSAAAEIRALNIGDNVGGTLVELFDGEISQGTLRHLNYSDAVTSQGYATPSQFQWLVLPSEGDHTFSVKARLWRTDVGGAIEFRHVRLVAYEL